MFAGLDDALSSRNATRVIFYTLTRYWWFYYSHSFSHQYIEFFRVTSNSLFHAVYRWIPDYRPLQKRTVARL